MLPLPDAERGQVAGEPSILGKSTIEREVAQLKARGVAFEEYPIRQRVGSSVVNRFSSCYANEIASTVTKEQADALAAGHPPIAAAIPRYEQTIRKTWRTCEKQYVNNAH